MKSVLVILMIAVLVLPVLNAVALMRGQVQGKTLLHLTHMDISTHPNRATRRSISPLLGRTLFVLRGETGVVTLAQAKLNATDDVDIQVIDEFRKSSWLLDNMAFDDVVNATGRGATLTYGYTRLVTESGSAFRAINAEYTKSEATKQRVSVDLKPFGGAFSIDRVLDAIAQGAETAFQMQQKIKSTRALFHDAVINGDTGVDANSFDGLDKALTGTSTEMNADVVTDWTAVNTEALAHSQIDVLDEFLELLDDDPVAIFGNKKGLAKIRAIARRAGYFTRSENAFGQSIEKYGNIALVDMGNKPASSSPIIPVEDRTVDGEEETGLTDLYAVRLGLDAFHGLSLAGQKLIRQWLPNFSEEAGNAGAVKDGEVEMVAAVALKRTKAAAVLRNVKVVA
jgi:hypothetical protein